MKSKYIGTASGYDGLRVHFEHSHHPSAVAQFAMHLLESPGCLLVGQPMGEDSAGRRVYEPLPAAEAAKRALDIAEAFFDQAGSRGLLIEVPPFTEEQLARLK
jgi:hypothetical protein